MNGTDISITNLEHPPCPRSSQGWRNSCWRLSTVWIAESKQVWVNEHFPLQCVLPLTLQINDILTCYKIWPVHCKIFGYSFAWWMCRPHKQASPTSLLSVPTHYVCWGLVEQGTTQKRLPHFRNSWCYELRSATWRRPPSSGAVSVVLANRPFVGWRRLVHLCTGEDLQLTNVTCSHEFRKLSWVNCLQETRLIWNLHKKHCLNWIG